MADYIDRERLTFHIAQEIEFFGEVNIKQDPCAYGDMLGLKRALGYVNALPTADVVEVKHGEWKKHSPDVDAMKEFHKLGIGKGMSEKSIFWTCSCCGGWGNLSNNYCPNCGAKMDGKALKERENE